MIFRDFIKPNQAKFAADEVNNTNLKPHIEKLSEAVKEASGEGKYEVKVRLDNIRETDITTIRDELVEIGYRVNTVNHTLLISWL